MRTNLSQSLLTGGDRTERLVEPCLGRVGPQATLSSAHKATTTWPAQPTMPFPLLLLPNDEHLVRNSDLRWTPAKHTYIKTLWQNLRSGGCACAFSIQAHMGVHRDHHPLTQARHLTLGRHTYIHTYIILYIFIEPNIHIHTHFMYFL